VDFLADNVLNHAASYSKDGEYSEANEEQDDEDEGEDSYGIETSKDSYTQ
jgi:hypothetical protein